MCAASPPPPELICRFPDCSRPRAAAEDGVGRPPEYCDDPAHNRGAAWRARRAAAAAVGAALEAQDGPARPVTLARARVGQYVDKVTGEVASLTEALTVVLDQLRIIGDPETTALQIDAVTAEADQRIAEASAQAARAEADRQVAEQQRDEADAAAEDANAQAAEMTGKADLAAAAEAAAVADLAAAEQNRRDQAEQFTLELAAAHEETAEQQERAADAERIVGEQAIRLAALTAELAAARQSHIEQVEQFNAQLAAARADTAAQQLRAENAERNLGEVSVRAATLTAELGAAQQRLDDERAHTDTRLADQRAAFEDRIAELRTEAADLRARLAQQPQAPPEVT